MIVIDRPAGFHALFSPCGGRDSLLSPVLREISFVYRSELCVVSQRRAQKNLARRMLRIVDSGVGRSIERWVR